MTIDKVMTKDEKAQAQLRLQDQSYLKLVGLLALLLGLTLVPDCLPFVDEAILVAMSVPVQMAIVRKFLTDIGLL
ncbi:MAG: hypothetical protein WAZ14_01620 [Patescibacteria group bacterium]